MSDIHVLQLYIYIYIILILSIRYIINFNGEISSQGIVLFLFTIPTIIIIIYTA